MKNLSVFNMEVIIDVQGFKKAYNEFIFKELAIVPLEEDVQPIVYLFEPPHDWNFLERRYKCENSWLTKNYHGIAWEDGDVPYAELEDILRSSTKDVVKIYVKGLEKQKWLNQFASNVFNIESLDCPSLTKLQQINDRICSNHNRKVCYNSNCAARNATILKKWLISYYKSPAFSMYKEKEYAFF